MHIDATVPENIIAALPYDGIGTRADWLRAGASERMLSDDRLRRIARGIYVAANDDRPLTVDRMAPLLPEDAVIGGWAAALAHGVRDASSTMVHSEPDLMLAYPGRDMHKKLPGFRTLRSALGPDDVVTIDDVRLTTVLRTAYDMTRFAPSLLSAVGLVDCFRFEINPTPVDAGRLQQVIDEHPRSRGNARIRKALALSSPRSRSIPESWLRTRMTLDCGIGLEAIAVNATLLHAGRSYELDLVDLTTGLVLEYDGEHHAGPAQRTRDSRKDVAVDEAGLVMLRVNAPLLRSPRELARTIGVRRESARARHCTARVTQMVTVGALRERPLSP